MENGCEHDGLLLERDLTALVAGLDTVLEAMFKACGGFAPRAGDANVGWSVRREL